MTTNALMELADRLASEADCQHRNALTFKKGTLGRDDHLHTESLLREAATQLRTAAAEGGSLDWLINDMEQTVASVESMWQAQADSDSSAQYEAGRQMAYMTLGNLLRDMLSEWKKKTPSTPTDSGAGRDGNVLLQALTDPQNQPSQWGTIPLSMIPARMDDTREIFPVGEPDYDDGYARGWNACLDRIDTAIAGAAGETK